MRSKGPRLIIGLTCLFFLSTCSPEPRLNILLITLDTTRADHIGCYGNKDIETPNIDRLAASGLRYENAFTPAPITLPAHTSIMTGTYPLFHGVRVNSGFYLPAEALTLAEILRGEGYDTAAFVGAFPLDSQTGIDQGFDLYDDNYPSSLEKGTHPLLRRYFDERPAAEVSATALSWLEQRDQRPFFLWTHYFDPHQPLRPPSPYRERYPSSPYDAEIASVDEAIGNVITWLETHDLLEQTLVVLTADHGEGLGEHGEATHALMLYSSTLRVPLIVRDPSHLTETSLSALVSTVDIFPTVLERLGLEVPKGNQGVALPRSDQDAPAEREIYSETLYGRLVYGWSPLERLTTKSSVLINGPLQSLLYDRIEDAEEINELSATRPRESSALRQRLKFKKAVLAKDGQRFSRGRNAAEDEDDAEAKRQAIARLASLGYAGGGTSTSPLDDRLDPQRPDPMLMMEVFTLHNEGMALNDIRRFHIAAAVLQRAEKLDPDNPAVLQALAQAQFGRGEMEGGHDVLERLLRIRPEDVPTLHLLARYHNLRAEPEQAAGLMQAAVALDPADVSSRLLLAYLLEDAGRVTESEETYRSILSREDGHTQALNGLATLVYRRGDTGQAVKLLETLLLKQPFYAPAWLNLGVIELNRGNSRRAKKLAERALQLRPGYQQALVLKSKCLGLVTQ